MNDPYLTLAPDFPHGTLEGSARGCVGKKCPASGFTCAELAVRHRTDAKCRKAYAEGARGQELRDLLDAGAALEVISSQSSKAKKVRR